MPPSLPESGNGQRSPTSEDGLHYYSPRDDDRETTRYLSAATQISLDYARRVVNRVIHEPYRALAPAYGADVTVVARWALDSLRRIVVRDTLLTIDLLFGVVLCWLFYSLSSPRWLWTPIAVLIMLTTAFIIVMNEHWVRWYRILGHQMLRGGFNPGKAPGSSSPRVNQRLKAIADRRNGNLVVFREHSAFAGSGIRLGREQIVIDVSRGEEADDGSPTEPSPFTTVDVHTAMLNAINAIKLRDMHVEERVFVNGRHVLGNQKLQRQPLEPPYSSVSKELLLNAVEYPTPDARAYVCAEIHGWQGQLVVTMFTRAVRTGDWLYIEYSFYLLRPIKLMYMNVDLLYEESWMRSIRKSLAWSIWRTVPLLVSAPFALAMQTAERLSWRAREATQAYYIDHGQAFDYGALRSIREDASGGNRQHYFLARDETMYLLLLQKSLLREVRHFLREHNIASEDFDEQVKVIINASYTNYSSHIGSVSQSTLAFGENAKASTEKKADSSS
jgi:hypothetical protein